MPDTPDLSRLGPTPMTSAGRNLLGRLANPGGVHSDIAEMEWRAIIHDIEHGAWQLATLDAMTAAARASWIEGWMQGAGQMTTWTPEALRSEAERQYERRVALGAP